ncbi:MAG TPA: hypothetical protein VGE74_11010 [Gemmata sp.]
MFDFSVRLRENAQLMALLSHYAQAGAEDRAAWRDRLMRLDGVGPEQLTAQHGELIAFDGIEQNTGHAVLRPDGTLAACYRVTPNGLREFRRLHGIAVVEEQSEAPEKQGFPRKRKDKTESHAGATAE